MIVVAAPRIESRATGRALRITLHILENGQDRTAGAAENCWLVPFPLRPDFYRMIGKRLVAIFAGIVSTATFHLDRDDIGRPVIVLATSLRIEIYALYVLNPRDHCVSRNRIKLYRWLREV